MIGHLRSKVSATPVLATLSTGNGGIRHISARTLELVIPQATATLSPGSAVLDLVRTDLTPPRHLAFLLEFPVRPPRHARSLMPETLSLRGILGPIRVETSSDVPVKVRVASAPVSVKVLGLPGPAGEQGVQGPAGPQGAPGNLSTPASSSMARKLLISSL